MVLTDAEIGSLVTVVVILLTALANYLNHLATVEAIKANQREIQRATDTINGQVQHIEAAAERLNQQAVEVAKALPPATNKDTPSGA